MNALDRYDGAEGALKSLTGSWVRSKILLSLLGGTKRIQVLAESVGTKDKTAHHSVRTMIDEGSIERVSNGYALTNIGRIRAALLATTINGSTVLNENADFWMGHDISGIPPALQIRIGELAGGEFLRAAPDSPLEVQRVFIEKVSSAKAIWGVSPYIAPGYEEMITGLLDNSAKVSLILTKGVIDKIESAVLRAWLDNENFSLYEILEHITVAFCVADELLSLGLCSSDGTYDPLGDLMCPGADAAAWGRELYEYYLKQARPVQLSGHPTIRARVFV